MADYKTIDDKIAVVDQKFVDEQLQFNWDITGGKIAYCQVVLEYASMLRARNQAMIRANDNNPLRQEVIDDNVKTVLKLQRMYYVRDYSRR